ncbi:MAG: amidoligase family protein [Rhodobacterales bacterium]|nr:amidoligase family protein [Puniceibacterium antarcticum]
MPRTNAGEIRRVGVEVELGGLSEERVAEIMQQDLGGDIDTRPEQGSVLRGSSLGDVEVYLDSRYLADAETQLEKCIREIAAAVVPVEIVTAPLQPSDIPKLDAVLQSLRRAGATGTNAGIFLGFGVHFNPEVTGTDLSDVLPILTAFALYEDALRDEAHIDLSRRALPFVDPYPRALVDALARGGIADMTALIDLYLKKAPSRNHALDMLALFTHLDPDRVGKVMDLKPIGARPTYHYRLPDCRMDEDDWSLALEWNRWVTVEKIAQNAALLDQLKDGWKKHRGSFTSLRGDWTKASRTMVQAAL